MARASVAVKRPYKSSAKRWDRDFPWVKPEDREPWNTPAADWSERAHLMSYDGQGHWTDHGPAPKGYAVGEMVWPEYVPPEPLVLDAGCLRCGEPVDAKGADETCSACLKEMTRKAALAQETPAEEEAPSVPALQVIQGGAEEFAQASPAERAAQLLGKVDEAQLAADDWKRRELMATIFNPPRDEYSRSSVSEERTMICRNPFVETGR